MPDTLPIQFEFFFWKRRSHSVIRWSIKRSFNWWATGYTINEICKRFPKEVSTELSAAASLDIEAQLSMGECKLKDAET